MQAVLMRKFKEIDAKIEENAERAQILVSFLTKGYLDPVLFNKQNNKIKAETARLREQRAALTASSAGGRSALSEAEALLKYLSKEGGIIEEFDELLFERFVEGITVFSPAVIGFE
jgi:site-specific DNA recombinase